MKHIEAMKLAIAWMENISDHVPERFDDEGIAVAKALYTALAEQEQSVSVGEPVAWQHKANHTMFISVEDWNNFDPQWHWMYRPLYTTPQQRKPMTLEQMAKTFADAGLNPDIQNDELSVARVVEAAHGIKEKNTNA